MRIRWRKGERKKMAGKNEEEGFCEMLYRYNLLRRRVVAKNQLSILKSETKRCHLDPIIKEYSETSICDYMSSQKVKKKMMSSVKIN